MKKIIAEMLAFTLIFGVCAAVPAGETETPVMSVSASAASKLPAPKYIAEDHYAYIVSEESDKTIEWSPIEGADGYYLYCYSKNDKKYKLYQRVNITSVTLGKLKPDSKYRFKVAAVRKIGRKIEIGEMSRELVVDTSDLSAGVKLKKVPVSKNNRFIDYKLTKNIRSAPLDSAAAEKAVEFTKKTPYYAEVMLDADEMRNADVDSDEIGIDIKEYFDKSGNILPKVTGIYTYDYDGNGKNESFMTVAMPYNGFWGIMDSTLLIFSDSSGNMQALGMYFSSVGNSVSLLDYGREKQLYIGGGAYGADTHYEIYGVYNGKPSKLLSGRFDIEKKDCFLRADGQMNSGGLFYYDTAAKDYRAIRGKAVLKKNLPPIDKSVPEYILEELNALSDNDECYVIGGKYYNIPGWGGGFILEYKNGKLVKAENTYVRGFNMENNKYNADYVEDIDLEKAVKNMEKV